jgi:PAP2 superfamily
VLLWLHQRRPAAFPFVRTTPLLASGLALVGYLAYPTAPPRLAGLGIADTVSNGHVDLNHGLVSSLYNPYAAIPSMHIGYAVIVATSLLRHGRHLLVRALGALYPPFVLLVIVATGNHFFLDAARRRTCRRAGRDRSRPRYTTRRHRPGHSSPPAAQATASARRAGGKR